MVKHMQEELAELVQRLQQAHKDRLVSVILYGSGAVDDRHEGFSDLNVLCVLTGIAVSDLARSEPVFEWWHKRGNPAGTFPATLNIDAKFFLTRVAHLCQAPRIMLKRADNQFHLSPMQ